MNVRYKYSDVCNSDINTIVILGHTVVDLAASLDVQTLSCRIVRQRILQKGREHTGFNALIRSHSSLETSVLNDD